jgi:hypothetical protein
VLFDINSFYPFLAGSLILLGGFGLAQVTVAENEQPAPSPV